MGRTMLIVSVLMATIYAGIMTTLQRRVLSVPNIISRNLLYKQAESVSDYALRTAIQNSVAYGQMAGEEGLIKWEDHFNNYNIQHCSIDSIKYTIVSGVTNSFRAESYVSGNLMGRTVNYRAEIAYSFPLLAALDLDWSIYLEMNQPQFNPSFDLVYDTSSNDNDANFYGNVDTRPHGTGVDGWKCANFNESSGGSIDGYIWHEGNSSMEVSSNFTIMCFAKLNRGTSAATFMWLPPDPNGAHIPGVGWGNVRRKPTGAIWFQNNTVYYTVTTQDGVTVQTSTPFTPTGKWPHNKDQYFHFALTYNQGEVKGYKNGVLVGTAHNPLFPLYRPPALINKGLYLGREYYGTPQAGDTFHYMIGDMDQAGLLPRTLTDAEIASYYNLTLNPAVIQYIRD